MKKIIIYFIFLIMLIPLSIVTVKATATNAYWHTEDESINITAYSENNPTIYYSTSDDTTVLFLNNYNGPGLYLFVNTALNEGQKFQIHLEGTNVITSDNIGIDLKEYNDKIKLDFTGDGTLQINAPVPISNDSRSKINISSKDENIEEDEINKTEEPASKTDEKIDYKLLFVISTIIVVILLVVTILLIIKLSKKK